MLPLVPRALDFARTAVKQIGIPLVVKAVSLVEARDVADILMALYLEYLHQWQTSAVRFTQQCHCEKCNAEWAAKPNE